MNKTFVMGDIHGNYKGLLQVLKRSNFNYDEDTLIQLGDIADGWSQTYECVEELCKIRNLIAIRGNHDQWFKEWLQTGHHGSQWEQGAGATYESYHKHFAENDGHDRLRRRDIPLLHSNFFINEQKGYHVDDQKRLFVHAGFNRHYDFYTQAAFIWMWDRDLWQSAMSFAAMIRGDKDSIHKFKTQNDFTEIFIGHTSTTNWGIDQPMKAGNIWNLDTGSGFDGKLTIMDINAREFWQSDNVKLLYPDEKGR